MNQSPLDLLSEDDRKDLERLLAIVHSETLSTAAKLEEVARLLARHGLLLPAPVTEQTWSATELAAELNVSAHAICRMANKHKKARQFCWAFFYRGARKTSPFRARMNSATAKPF